MGAVPVKGLTDADALEMAHHGSNETVEVRGRLTSAKVLADLIAAFANQRGGFIIFGYDPRNRKLVGCRQHRLERRHNEAQSLLRNNHISSIRFHHIHGRHLGVIYVPPVDRLIDSPGGLVVRIETSVRAMSKSRILEVLQKTHAKMSFEDFGTLLLGMQQRVDETGDLARRNSSWLTKVKEQIFGFIVGAALSALVALALSRFR